MADNEQIKITITKDGPYEVHPGIPLNQASIETDHEGHSYKWGQGKQYENPTPGEAYHLCRCGHSKTKPFCDASHTEVEFCGYEHADRPPYAEHAQLQPGPEVSLMDDETLCIGARFCDRGATVWRLAQSADEANIKQAVQEACDCPSGRLTVVDGENRLLEPDLPQGISLIEDPINNCRGPLWVKGNITVEGAYGEQYETRNRVTLCRCGESKNMPYCDAEHYNCSHMQGLDA